MHQYHIGPLLQRKPDKLSGRLVSLTLFLSLSLYIYMEVNYGNKPDSICFSKINVFIIFQPVVSLRNLTF